MLKQRKECYTLTNKAIDLLSGICVEALTEAETDRKDIIRIRLSLEEILGIWRKELGETQVLCRTGKKFGRQYIEFAVAGRRMNVLEEGEDLFLSNRLLAQAGLTLVYSYQNGENRLLLNPPKKARMGQMTQLLTAIVSAVLLGFFVRGVSGEIRNITLMLTEPFFSMILGLLRAISSPLIFLSVCWGIISIGDLSVVGRIGGQVTKRLILDTFLLSAITMLLICWMFPLSLGGIGNLSGGIIDIYKMILNIVPSDMISPFLNGNALQIIFLGVCVGVALLVLGDKVSAVRDIIVQANEVVQFLMRLLGKLIPLFVFLSIFNLLQSEFGIGFKGIIKVFCIAVPGCALVVSVYLLLIVVRFKMPFISLVKKLLPTYLIGLSTASSAAAFATNLETCEKQLGIPRKIVNFAIPLGQVIFKPGGVVGFLAVSLCMAQHYGVEITPVWLVTAVLIVGLLAMAAPPIPGGALTCYTVMFVQLGIPGEAIAVAVAINSILDFVMTAANLTCLQAEVMFAAKKLGFLKG
ncbi:MAG: dicarboxylate/amino acid:cation symporter [Clostridium sp.]|nr:dicarboxylate/amino acid:cation symporter [Clostridium sp.]